MQRLFKGGLNRHHGKRFQNDGKRLELRQCGDPSGNATSLQCRDGPTDTPKSDCAIFRKALPGNEVVCTTVDDDM